jgi:hypothetical protein
MQAPESGVECNLRFHGVQLALPVACNLHSYLTLDRNLHSQFELQLQFATQTLLQFAAPVRGIPLRCWTLVTVFAYACPGGGMAAVADGEGGMTVLPVLNVSRWTATAVRLLVGSVPAAIATIFVVLILFVGLFLNERRQKYALTAAKYAGGLAKELVGSVSLVNASADLSMDVALLSRQDADAPVIAELIAEDGRLLKPSGKPRR